MPYILPSTAKTAVYILAALLPAAFLLRYIYKKDGVEKEPPGLLLRLLLLGAAATGISIVFEYLGEGLLSAMLGPGSPGYTVLFAFLVVAVVEEGAKFLLLKLATWRNSSFNYRFDAVVYAVFISLGFAAVENVGYVLRYGLSAAVLRALLSVPGHMGFAVFMGFFYGRAKLCENRGDLSGKRGGLIAAYVSAVFLHGFYDACAMSGSALSTVVFVAFVIIMYIAVFRLIKRESRTDGPL